jgi:hypothetical protein
MPVIKKPNQHFDVLTWSGTGGGSGATRSITGLNFQPDLIWEKARTSGSNHQLLDSVRGVGQNKVIASNSQGAQPTPAGTESLYGWLSAINSDGFTVTNGTSTFDNWNKSGDDYVAWNWKAGGTAVNNTSGTITSQVSVNTTAKFSIVKFSTGSAGNFTVGHGLGTTPGMITIKKLSGTGYWDLWHKSFTTPATEYMYLDLLNGVASDSRQWANAAPTDTLFSGESGYEFAANSDFIAYCWAEVAGYSKFGNYTGASSANVFVYTGFKPAYVLIKKSSEISTTYGWPVVDKSRPNYNPTQEVWADQAVAGTTSNYEIDLLSNGFCIRAQNNTNVNASGKTYLYTAFAEAPLKYATAR